MPLAHSEQEQRQEDEEAREESDFIMVFDIAVKSCKRDEDYNSSHCLVVNVIEELHTVNYGYEQRELKDAAFGTGHELEKMQLKLKVPLSVPRKSCNCSDMPEVMNKFGKYQTLRKAVMRT